MRIRHIIVEGCDGTGKTNMVNRIAKWRRPKVLLTDTPPPTFPHFSVHERASTSIGGPVPDLVDWVRKDVATMADQPPSVYDRHPLISEPIYGPICRNAVPGSFNDGVWMATTRSLVAHYCAVIWCVPPWRDVARNIAASADNQMSGVTINARRIYDAYDRASRVWPGVSIRWDYTRPNAYDINAYLTQLIGKE